MLSVFLVDLAIDLNSSARWHEARGPEFDSVLIDRLFNADRVQIVFKL